MALTALAITGCGGSGDPHARAVLHATNEHRLLVLLNRARTDVATHNKGGVDAALGRFVADVNSLRGSRELTTSTAAALDRQALATEAHASRQLSPTSTQSGVPVGDVQTTTAASPSPRPPHPQPAVPEGAAGGPHGAAGSPGHAKGKHQKGWQGPGDGQQGDGGNGGGSGDGDS